MAFTAELEALDDIEPRIGESVKIEKPVLVVVRP